MRSASHSSMLPCMLAGASPLIEARTMRIQETSSHMRPCRQKFAINCLWRNGSARNLIDPHTWAGTPLPTWRAKETISGSRPGVDELKRGAYMIKTDIREYVFVCRGIVCIQVRVISTFVNAQHRRVHLTIYVYVAWMHIYMCCIHTCI